MEPNVLATQNKVKALPEPISVERNDMNIRKHQEKRVAFHKKWQGKDQELLSRNNSDNTVIEASVEIN